MPSAMRRAKKVSWPGVIDQSGRRVLFGGIVVVAPGRTGLVGDGELADAGRILVADDGLVEIPTLDLLDQVVVGLSSTVVAVYQDYVAGLGYFALGYTPGSAVAYRQSTRLGTRQIHQASRCPPPFVRWDAGQNCQRCVRWPPR